MKSGRAVLGFIFILVITAACNQKSPPLTPALTTPPPAAAPAATAAATAASAPQASSLPSTWDDRSIFRSGLVPGAQAALDQLPGASLYHLDLHIAPDLTSLQGQEQVRYTNQEDQPLDSLYFQLFPNQAGGKSVVSAVLVDGQPVTPASEADNTTLRVPLPAPLPPGGRTLLQLDFKVEVPSEVGGNYGLFGYLDNILVLDGFYPAIPVYDAQGWHAGKVPPNADSTFQDASFYLVRVTAPAALTLVASGVAVERSQQAADQVVTFAAGPARDFYLAASDRFTVLSETVGQTTVNSYAFKDRSQGDQLALDAAVKALKSYSARLGAYPYTEFDLVSTPMQGALGIEYPGITALDLDLYDPAANINGTPAPVLLESTVAHEVGHQWFYNVVGNDQALEPWLDEAVTQYLTGLYFLDIYGQPGLDNFRSSWLSRWQRVDRQPLPIGLPAANYQGREYGAIVYGRGPLFLDALAQKMGQPTFDAFLRDYYQSHQWGIATTADFQHQAEKDCQCDLTALFAEWVYPQ